MTNSPLTALGLLVGRIALGVTFFAHGLQKIFENGVGATADAFAAMGVPLPQLAGPFVGYLELIGGVLLVFGVGTRIVAALFAVVSFVALFLVHLPAGFYAADGGIELVFVLGLVSVALALTGPGRLAVDSVFVRGRRRAADADAVAPAAGAAVGASR